MGSAHKFMIKETKSAHERKQTILLSSYNFLQAFVVFVTMCREAYDDFIRFRRDREVNSQLYKKLTKKGISNSGQFTCKH